jgi:Methyltransferase domain
MGTAFILLGLEHNGAGRLISVDLPPIDQRILDQGTRPLPGGKRPGWLVPDYLRRRHDWRLGKAEVLLPQGLAENGRVANFLHDSDYRYAHLMFEVCLAWGYLNPRGMIIVHNIDQSSAFADFSRGVDAQHFMVSTFDSLQRTWQHGVVLKDGI